MPMNAFATIFAIIILLLKKDTEEAGRKFKKIWRPREGNQNLGSAGVTGRVCLVKDYK